MVNMSGVIEELTAYVTSGISSFSASAISPGVPFQVLMPSALSWFVITWKSWLSFFMKFVHRQFIVHPQVYEQRAGQPVDKPIRLMKNVLLNRLKFRYMRRRLWRNMMARVRQVW